MNDFSNFLATPGTEEKKPSPKAAAAKPKAAAKAPVKPLPQLMEEDVIPQLIEILQAQDDLSEIELTFQENRVISDFFHESSDHSVASAA